MKIQNVKLKENSKKSTNFLIEKFIYYENALTNTLFGNYMPSKGYKTLTKFKKVNYRKEVNT